MRPLSETVSRVTGKTFSRKYIALGKILAEWEKIVGPDFATRAIPIRINYRSPPTNRKDAKKLASLHIATTEAWATTLHYQKDMILERISMIFGGNWIDDIRFVNVPPQTLTSRQKTKRLLTEGEKKFLSDILTSLEDRELRSKLETLGQEIIKRV